MLEAERAGAKALVVFLDEHARSSEAWRTLRRVQADEAHNCVLLGELLKRARVEYSHATGEFYAKAIAVQGRRSRIDFLCRGLRWAVTQFESALPRLDEEAGSVLTKMRDSHLRSIAACETLAKTLAD
jgi:nitronate monooxygenase